METIYQQIREKRGEYKSNKEIIDELKIPQRTFYDYLHRMAKEDKQDIIQIQSTSHRASILKRMQESTIKAIHVLQEIMDDSNTPAKTKIQAVYAYTQLVCGLGNLIVRGPIFFQIVEGHMKDYEKSFDVELQ